MEAAAEAGEIAISAGIAVLLGPGLTGAVKGLGHLHLLGGL